MVSRTMLHTKHKVKVHHCCSITLSQFQLKGVACVDTVSYVGTNVSYLHLLLTRADFTCWFFLAYVPSKFKPSCTDLSVSSAPKLADLHVSSISTFRGPIFS